MLHLVNNIKTFSVKLLFLLALCLFITVSQATQNIDIVGGSDASLPKIAVINFKNDTTLNDHAADIIANDLSITGEFNVKEYGSLSEVESGTLYVISGSFANPTHIGYDVTDIKQKSPHILLHQYINYNPSNDMDHANFRQALHTISNATYKKLTGSDGIFTSKIAFVLRTGSLYKIIVSDYDGYNQKTIIQSHNPLSSLAWGQHDKQLAYVSFEAGKPIVYMQNIYSGKRFVVANFDGSNSSPEFTPNNNQLAVTLSKDYGSHIYLVPNAPFTSHTSAQPLIHFGTIDTEASIANNGNVVFTSNHDGGPQIFMTNLSGTTPTRITWNLGHYNTTPRFSHDGSKVTFISRNEGILKTYVLDLRTKSAYSVSLTTHLDLAPSFAPNDKLILFSSDNHLYVVNTTGTIQTQLHHVNTNSSSEIIDQRWAN